ncbi:amidohydrolase family protein [Actinoallomurus iriomotensis]|uniref:TRZ/ATZ family hydrolase n=1 Tax=Actinoallomurus iriomotensis TaxID=478107 RepID=A0A9W6S1U0_9ACTN|nr:amidohydrolase family protein [Actinoallomurus iriomotensis]GLY85633.1 TRZ/ATZ family hydrolase [Actinoallomurus iriomotensis]
MSTLLIRSGHVTSLDESIGEIPDGDVLIDGDTITAVGRGLEAPGARVVDAAGKIVIPGLVDAHRHVWQSAISGETSPDNCLGAVLAEPPDRYGPEDVYAGVLRGALRAIDSGVTTVADWSQIITTPAHADENVRALRDSGIRALFLYGPPIGDDVMRWFAESTVRHPADVRRVRSELLCDDTARVTMGLALRGPEFSTPEVTAADFGLARELGVPISIRSGLPAYLGRSRTIDTLDRLGLLGPDVHHAHGVRFSGADLARIAATGGSVVVCPMADVSMARATGTGRFPVTGRAVAHGLLPALGTDLAADGSAGLFGEMRRALASERERAIAVASTHGETPVHLTARDALRFATVAGAAALGIGGRIGTISPGKRADLAIVDGPMAPWRDPAAVVLESRAADVDTVIIDGEVVKHAGRLAGPAARRASQLREASCRRLSAGTGLVPA